MLVLAGAAVCARLGVWQLDRLAQRRVFNSHVYAMRALPPLELPTPGELTSMEYRAVQATGTYDFEHQVAIRNQIYNDQYGFHLLTPLVLLPDASAPQADRQAVLVDRGWIPAEEDPTPADWHKYDTPGKVTISGVIRLSQTTASFGGAADPTLTPKQTGLDLWVYVNIDRISRQIPYPILPVYVQISPDPKRTGPPVPFQPELDLSEGPHQGYAMQWFGFASLLLVGYPFYLRKQESGKI